MTPDGPSPQGDPHDRPGGYPYDVLNRAPKPETSSVRVFEPRQRRCPVCGGSGLIPLPQPRVLKFEDRHPDLYEQYGEDIWVRRDVLNQHLESHGVDYTGLDYGAANLAHEAAHQEKP